MKEKQGWRMGLLGMRKAEQTWRILLLLLLSFSILVFSFFDIFGSRGNTHFEKELKIFLKKSSARTGFSIFFSLQKIKRKIHTLEENNICGC